MAASDEFPTPEAATAPTPEPIIEFEENVEEINLVEVTEDGSITDIQGELNLEYPLLILADTNDSVVIKINKLDVAVAPSPIFVEVSTEVVDPESTGFDVTKTHTVNIYLAEQVRVELTSQTFEIDPVMPTTQKVDLDDSSQITTWIWGIKAPEKTGVHKFFVKVYLADDTTPSWIRDIPVTVVDNLPVDTELVSPPVSTSPPPNNFGAILLAILAVMALLGTGAFVYLRPQNNKNSKGNDGTPPLHERSTADILNAKYRFELTNALEAAFNLAELKDLCYDLDINYENFEGGFVEKTQAMVAHLFRHGRIQELIDYLGVHRPDIALPKHQVAIVLEDNFGRAELKDICSHFDIDVEDVEGGSTEIIRTIVATLTKNNQLQDIVDYLTKNHPEVDLRQDG